jgi:hypothetical protein
MRTRGGEYYPRLDAHAASWMLPPEKPPDEQAQPRGSIFPALFGPLLSAFFCLRSHVLRGDRRAPGDLLAVVIGVLYHSLSSNLPRVVPLQHPTLAGPRLCALLSPRSLRPDACPLRLFAALELPRSPRKRKSLTELPLLGLFGNPNLISCIEQWSSVQGSSEPTLTIHAVSSLLPR